MHSMTAFCTVRNNNNGSVSATEPLYFNIHKKGTVTFFHAETAV